MSGVENLQLKCLKNEVRKSSRIKNQTSSNAEKHRCTEFAVVKSKCIAHIIYYI